MTLQYLSDMTGEHLLGRIRIIVGQEWRWFTRWFESGIHSLIRSCVAMCFSGSSRKKVRVAWLVAGCPSVKAEKKWNERRQFATNHTLLSNCHTQVDVSVFFSWRALWQCVEDAETSCSSGLEKCVWSTQYSSKMPICFEERLPASYEVPIITVSKRHARFCEWFLYGSLLLLFEDPLTERSPTPKCACPIRRPVFSFEYVDSWHDTLFILVWLILLVHHWFSNIFSLIIWIYDMRIVLLHFWIDFVSWEIQRCCL
jgi:hypothetical protein